MSQDSSYSALTDVVHSQPCPHMLSPACLHVQGFVYVKFANQAGAEAAHRTLNLRWYSGKQVRGSCPAGRDASHCTCCWCESSELARQTLPWRAVLFVTALGCCCV